MLAAGQNLSAKINTEELEAEAVQFYSVINEWLLKQYLSYLYVGKRIANVRKFVCQKLNIDGVAENVPRSDVLI
ncbi:MAG: hypothetical protein JW915_02030 [Chitinispirillaceae bacterium]|nr:hypothetical protein [Chitinispirillaceae bacterium]